jgi:hypothetical protein
MHTINWGHIVKHSIMLKHGFILVYVKIYKQVPKNQIVCKLITFWVHWKITFKNLHHHVHVPFLGMYGKKQWYICRKTFWMIP